ncbi:MAG TPA: VOC family protein [Woeseiaceae bacterium]|nr:VOC family protein [Woeseiaceae bacterium]
MATPVKAIPEGYEAVIPYLVVNDGAGAIDFYKKVFNATEIMRYDDKGKVGHAELKIGQGVFMLADEYPEMGYRSPRKGELPAAGMMIYVEDVDQTVKRALKEGATEERPVADQFYGDRAGGIVDPYGHRWYIATHIEDLSPEEMEKRAAASR